MLGFVLSPLLDIGITSANFQFSRKMPLVNAYDINVCQVWSNSMGSNFEKENRYDAMTFMTLCLVYAERKDAVTDFTIGGNLKIHGGLHWLF